MGRAVEPLGPRARRHDERRAARAAFTAFYEAHGDDVLRALTFTLGDADLAVDATQEAMARAWRDWAAVAEYRNPVGWVYRVGLNWARSRYRRLGRELLGATRDRAESAGDLEDPELARALAILSHDHRCVLVLRFYLDWSLESVAEALQVAVGTVKSRQHWALRRLREELGAFRPPDHCPEGQGPHGVAAHDPHGIGRRLEGSG